MAITAKLDGGKADVTGITVTGTEGLSKTVFGPPLRNQIQNRGVYAIQVRGTSGTLRWLYDEATPGTASPTTWVYDGMTG